jgi:hypothetical protein
MERLAVGLGENGNGSHAQFLARPVDAQRNLATIGDQNLLENDFLPLSRVQ